MNKKRNDLTKSIHPQTAVARIFSINLKYAHIGTVQLASCHTKEALWGSFRPEKDKCNLENVSTDQWADKKLLTTAVLEPMGYETRMPYTSQLKPYLDTSSAIITRKKSKGTLYQIVRNSANIFCTLFYDYPHVKYSTQTSILWLVLLQCISSSAATNRSNKLI